ncbi:ATP synthase F1 subunit gamma [Thermaerobacter sp. PB12/4term]|uniref:ATP synthase F1 subunit gamma n=1 Tax=Thermaerobacter sp. PB12/4term TaxID=2293838 RepID=UPI000E329A97|nr:ATP synthase F1 subunit gamma [Thermaerobacter sp. PB12/4term]QIA26231.1 ATP synthase F1 subunit gamma [Thermaerobacter sp. PB12/4term]
MASMRDIRRRIRAVRSTQQITRAMYMVAAAKLKKAEEAARSGRPYAAALRAMLARLAGSEQARQHPLVAPRPVRRAGLVIITGDRGLAGSYNANVIRRAEQELRQLPEGVEPVLVTVGRKGRDHFRRRGYPLAHELTGIGEDVDFATARELARWLVDRYLAGAMDEVRLIYTEYRSAISQRPVVMRLVPVAGLDEQPGGEPGRGAANPAGVEPAGRQAPGSGPTPGSWREYIYEPSEQAILEALLPKYVQILVFRALQEAKASEHGARMTAMKNATDNAGELIDTLTLEYNRARQAAITKELAEIVSGAEALKG